MAGGTGCIVYFIGFAATEIYVRGSNPFYQKREESHDILYVFAVNTEDARFLSGVVNTPGRLVLRPVSERLSK